MEVSRSCSGCVMTVMVATVLGGCASGSGRGPVSAPESAGEAPPPAMPAESPAPPPPPPVARSTSLPPARSAPTEAIPCPAPALRPFPWPTPPEPSVSTLLPRRLLFGDDSSPRSLADVAARLERPITAAGYRLPRYLGAGCAGFAIVLDLERIETDGARRPGADGFAPPGQEESFSLASYIKRLFYAAPGLYRQIVFIVSEERLAGTTPAPTEAQLRAIIRDGVSSLPPAFAKVPYAPTHEVTVLIYEFTKGPNAGDARLIPPRGRLGAVVHLQKAGLY